MKNKKFRIEKFATSFRIHFGERTFYFVAVYAKKRITISLGESSDSEYLHRILFNILGHFPEFSDFGVLVYCEANGSDWCNDLGKLSKVVDGYKSLD